MCGSQAGIVHLQWEDSSSVVSTCCLDGALRLWDARSGHMVSEYRGHTAEILDFTINRYQLTKHLKSPQMQIGVHLALCSQPPYKTDALLDHPYFWEWGKTSESKVQCSSVPFVTSQGVCVFRSPFLESGGNISVGLTASTQAHRRDL